MAGTVTLDRLHRVFQRIMGWTDSHLHEFIIAGCRYGKPDPERGPTVILPERAVKLRDVAPSEDGRFEYVYDFGDNWWHEVVVEKILATTISGGVVCLAGERCCPPEDCGGIPGYEEFVAAVRDTSNPRHREMVEWVGGRFDPEGFDLAAINRALRRIR